MIIRCLFVSSVLIVTLFGINLKSLFTYTFDVNKKYDMEKAKTIYFKNKCHTCHGDNAQKSVIGSRILKDMSAQDLKAALIGYTLDSSASATASQMAFYARNLTHDDMDNIIAYIKGGNFALDLQVQELLEEEPKQKTKHNTFLK
ncbi:cytochrome c [Campylobacter sp. VicNov18]|uniref:c-type cytochrome n=1 Tax=Campylobacter bilis TaxID=2691918 RepID=UPI00130D9BE3|nr:cytochrome c [Campylobacter bilis]MPV63725.1 c-type cytochrome [Campylobacter hepaticus]MBM0637226.1 c-type cytochrome [Campylobacter bilis]MCC8277945.1 cytochrome c [Campylobacter bilis]MCC8298876.1 cytochrome c [Campylobacter bilis]MCC8300854.1 cytochrome c [Campylobacter bilis]